MDAIAITDAPGRIKPGRRLSLAQALEMQRILHSLVVTKQGRPLELASCARAWSELEERKRILRGKPLPGQLRPVAPREKNKGQDTGLVK